MIAVVTDPAATWSRAVEELHGLGYALPAHAPPADVWLRIAAAGKRCANRSAAVKLSADGGAVHLVDHASGLRHTVRAGDAGLTGFELTRIRTEARRAKRAHEAERDARHRAGTEAAARAWLAARPTASHPYLTAKAVHVEGLRVDDAGVLLVPRHDVDGVLVGLQRIAPDGTKRYAAGAPTPGTFFTLGAVDPAGTLCIAEGLATAATVRADTGCPTVVAFDAGNLEPVARALRARHPRVRLLVCGDDDRATPENPGRTKAIEAAEASDALVWLPTFCADCAGCTDHNDVALCRRGRA